MTNTHTPTVTTEAQAQDGDRDSVTHITDGMFVFHHDTETGHVELGIHRVMTVQSVWEHTSESGITTWTEIVFGDSYGNDCTVTVFGMTKTELVTEILKAPSRF